jgi:hypothetical protein
MPRRKGERTSRMNERDFPHIVELPVPEGGFGRTLDAIHSFHRSAVRRMSLAAKLGANFLNFSVGTQFR